MLLYVSICLLKLNYVCFLFNSERLQPQLKWNWLFQVNCYNFICLLSCNLQQEISMEFGLRSVPLIKGHLKWCITSTYEIPLIDYLLWFLLWTFINWLVTSKSFKIFSHNMNRLELGANSMLSLWICMLCRIAPSPPIPLFCYCFSTPQRLRKLQ